MSFLPAVKTWIWISALATLAGWTLSAVGLLNKLGYIGFAVVVAIVMIEASARGALKFSIGRWRWEKIRARFARPLPLMFAALTVLILIGGVIYPSNNHMAHSYRIPRVLHWLGGEQWQWIFTPTFRMNTRPCGMEWLMAPVLLFTKSDRGLFLLNFIPFLLFPGLIFSVFTRLGISARVACQWMWLLPTGYVFVLQAGSTGNDGYAAVYSLAVVDFALRAWRSRRISELNLSLLSIALLTGVKSSNMPLVLPWLVLAVPLWRLWRDHPLSATRMAVLAIMVSFIPTALLNHYYSNAWLGAKLEIGNLEMKNPLVGIYGNTLLLLCQSFCPPFFPLAGWWTRHVLEVLPGAIVRPMLASFEAGFQALWELPTEDWVGIGAGVSVLGVVALWWKLQKQSKGDGAMWMPATSDHFTRFHRLALIAPWVSLLAYFSMSGLAHTGRILTPYYPLLLPLLLAGREQSQLVRRAGWRLLTWGVYAVAFVVLLITPPRPLWPAKTLLARALETWPGQPFLSRALNVYTVYSIRSDPLAKLRASIPGDVKIIGYLSGPDDLETWLWRPFGSRRVEGVSVLQPQEQLDARGIQYAIVSLFFFEQQHQSFDEWRAKQERRSLLIRT